ncbi:aldehyde dehydrogenase family protein [Comamonas thiooxydans]|uniref:Toluenesulfonate aldehyde dehydrogenase TsaD n=2 Tax=Comamonas thiooxydans TaxID=363952 RepID=D8DCY5_9BURK|nr:MULTISPECIES: aldehyde dehydrogenase family protein [Comamonas]EFI59211.1 aldehyde dehydrogenase [Comamonas thiooxydans]KGG84645.1 aldehyde dehydrogenase [Comamonas thiooxydans]MDH1332571.1 aldehyde dehydrogenase family protein [Comamonas thiooxydans]MDH1739582.1 aldehyde dehydrogenase family protein [Comamonas thiooxydans]MDH1784998.1 aldehyde dehydrogenase family protein [Comamonas thiooxydans]
MQDHLQFYIDGQWVNPVSPRSLEVINPSNEQAIARISMGSAADVDKAVAAARRAFESYSRTSREERLALLAKVLEVYQSRYGDFVQTISQEMGAPLWLSKAAQAAMGVAHLSSTIEVLKNFAFEHVQGSTAVVHEPVGVVGMITPWNWPINQIMCKVAPALAAGCTMVLKPSEVAPLNALLVAEVLHEAGVPAGVFNLVNGDGPGVGEAMSSHPGIDMMTFTGSTRAGIAVAKAAADSVKRVAQELGGKSANIVLDDANLQKAVTQGVQAVLMNSGQSCNAPTRMFVPRALHGQAVEIARSVAGAATVADALAEGMHMGPVVSEAQWGKIQALIRKGIEEGATLVAGGTGRPEGLVQGYFVKPTVFADVSNDMSIAREEIFGPVLVMIPYDDEEDAIRMANDTVYGLSGYVQSGSLERARRVAARLRTGMVHLNGAGPDFNAPFGGYKQSGNGREWGEHGFRDFLETKAVMGYGAA